MLYLKKKKIEGLKPSEKESHDTGNLFSCFTLHANTNTCTYLNFKLPKSYIDTVKDTCYV